MLPSSAPLVCLSWYRTLSQPQLFGQVSSISRSVEISDASICWMSPESLSRSLEGKEEGFEVVVIRVLDVSGGRRS